MAGNPLRRKRALEAATRAAQAAGVATDQPVQTIPDATTAGEPARARAPAPARAGQPRQAFHTTAPQHPAGPEARRVIDNRDASDIENFQAQLTPNMTVRIERMRPSWAAGWIDDVQLETNQVAELFDYLRNEHGGQLYRAQLLGRDGRILYQTKIPIAGPVRRDGRVCTRDQWEGIEEPKRAADNPQRTAAAANSGEVTPLALLSLFLQNQSTSMAAVTKAVEKMGEQTEKQVTTLVNAVLHRDDTKQSAQTLGQQLKDFAQTSKAVQQISEALGGGKAPPPPAAAEVDPIRQATAEILKEAIRNEMGNRRGAQRPPQQQQRPQQQQAPQPQQQQPRAAGNGGAPPPGSHSRRQQRPGVERIGVQ
jgi:hypothetical protein